MKSVTNSQLKLIACAPYFDKWTKRIAYFLCFMWLRLSDPPNWNGIEPFVQFLLNNGLPVDIKCFEELSDMKKFTASCLNDEEFTTSVIQQKQTRYFENSEMSSATQNCCRFHSSLPFSFIMQI